MSHRTGIMTSQSRNAPLTFAAAVALAAVCLQADEAVTRATASPATRGTDWNQRIDAVLAETGSVDSIVSELKSTTADTPETLAAKVRLANEQGDSAGAVEALQAAARVRPTDALLLMRLAQAQERVGAAEAARQTFTSAAAVAADPTPKNEALLRLATSALDEGRAEEGATRLTQVGGDSAWAGRAGVIAFLYGHYGVAADCLHRANGQSANDLGLIFLEGNAALKAHRSDAAAAAFEQASHVASKPADRLYAQERRIAAARQAGTLSTLIDAWLVDQQLPAGQLLLVVTTLRELNRTADLLDWWQRASSNPAWAPTVFSRRFVNEVLGAARSAGRSSDVIDICRGLMDRSPQEAEWFSATVAALLEDGRTGEADALLDARLRAHADGPAGAERIGNLAAALGRDDVAVRAARTLVALDGVPAITGHLLESDIRRRNGDEAQGVARLHAAAALALDHPEGLATVVTALESADLSSDAIDLLQKAVARRPTEESLDRLSSLLLEQGRPAEAIPVLRTLMRTTSSDAARVQAGRRMLDAAGSAGGLDTVIAELRSRLQDGKPNLPDLSLLADAYLRQNDLAAAVRVFEESKLLGTPERLHRVAVLYLRAKKYDEAADILRQLCVADPDNATDTLQQLADVHLKRGRPDDAGAVIREIEHRIGAGPTSFALLAGVMDQLGRPAEAAALHRRAIALNPKDTEQWLLWAKAVSAAGNAPLSRRRLAILCSEATTDDLFATAVDGLLNLDSPPAMLRVARREAMQRLAAQPNRGLLFQVVADLSDELHDPEVAVRVIDASTIAGADERSQRLRDVLDLAGRKKAIDVAVDAGRSLLALGDDFPPQLFLQLGEQLLVDGREAEASRAFARAQESAGDDLIVIRVAALYEKYGAYGAALDKLTPLADRRRADADYQEDVARLSELVGRTGTAFDHYLAALALQGREMKIGNEEQPPRPTTGNAFVLVMPTKREAALRRIVAGMILTGRTPARQQATVAQLRSLLDRLVAEAAAHRRVPADVATVAAALRRAGWAFLRPDDADAADRLVLTRWPSDTAYQQSALAARVDNGLILRAERFAAEYGIDAGPAVRCAVASTRPSTSPSALPPLEAVQQLSNLVAQGRTEQARAALNAMPYDDAVLVEQRSSYSPPTVPVRTVIAAAAVIGDSTAAINWSLFWLDGGRREERPSTTQPATSIAVQPANERRPAETDSSRARRYVRVIDATWSLLTDGGRSQLVAAVVDRLRDFKDPQARAEMSLRAMQMSAELGITPLDILRLASDASVLPNSNQVARACDVILATPAPDRAAALRLAIERVPVSTRLELITQVISRTPDAFLSHMRDAIAAAAAQVPPGQVLNWGDWPCRVSDRSLLGVLAETVLRSALDPNAPTSLRSATVLTTAAMAFAAAGDAERADETADRAIAALLTGPPSVTATSGRRQTSVPPAQPSPVVLLRATVASMSRTARAARLVAMAGGPESSTDTPPTNRLRQLRVILLDAQGDRAGALDALRHAFAEDATDADTANLYLDRLKDDGRWAEVVEAFGRQDASPFQQTPATVAVRHALTQLYRWPEVRFADPPVVMTVNMAAQAVARDEAGLAASLRRLIQNDSTAPFYTPFPALPGLGGFTPPYDAETQQPPALFDQATQWPGTIDDMMSSLRSFAAEDVRGATPRLSWVATVLARAAASDNLLADRLVTQLTPRVEGHLLSHAERQLIVSLATLPGVRVPANWLDDLWPAALADSSYVESRRLRQALAVRSKADPHAASDWVDMMTTWGQSRPDRGGGLWPIGSLIALCDQNPMVAEDRLRFLLSTGSRDAEDCSLTALWARTAAARDDRPAFESRLNELLQIWAFQWATRSATGPLRSDVALDLSLVLPDQNSSAEHRRVWLDIVRGSLLTLSETQPSNTDITRLLSELGSVLLRQGDRETAKALYRDAEKLADAQGPGEFNLHVADLATSLGDDNAALDRQIKQLRHRCLPAPRMYLVIKAMEERGDHALSRRLSGDAAVYCKMPVLQ